MMRQQQKGNRNAADINLKGGYEWLYVCVHGVYSQGSDKILWIHK